MTFMNHKPRRKRFYFGMFCVALCLQANIASAQSTDGAAKIFQRIARNADWQLLEQTPLQFPTFHPQGMVKLGEYYYLSSVETLSEPEALADDPRYDRSTGSGVAHLFKFDQAGELLDEITLGDEASYHPGGIDFDGEYIWVSVAQYRPDSQSIIYRVNPLDMKAEEVMHFDDHLGLVVHDPRRLTLHAANWGASKFYSWQRQGDSYFPENFQLSEKSGSITEYQDCQSLPIDYLLCSGLADFTLDNTHTLTMGVIDLLELESKQRVHQITVNATIKSNDILSRNPSYFEVFDSDSVYFYFIPEDDNSNLYKYEVSIKP